MYFFVTMYFFIHSILISACSGRMPSGSMREASILAIIICYFFIIIYVQLII
jgi:hypothetical protein